MPFFAPFLRLRTHLYVSFLYIDLNNYFVKYDPKFIQEQSLLQEEQTKLKQKIKFNILWSKHGHEEVA